WPKNSVKTIYHLKWSWVTRSFNYAKMDFGCPYRIGDCSSLCCDGLAVEPSRSPGSSDLRSSERRYPRVYYSAATWTSNYACFRLASDFTPDEMTEEVPRTQMVSRNSAKKYMSDKIVFTRSRSFGTEPIEFAQIMDTERSAVLIRVVQS